MDLFGLFLILVVLISECLCLQSPNKPSLPEYREAYFTSANSSSMRMWYTVSLHHHIGISFRTCAGGELFSQRYKGYSFQLSALSENVVFTVKWPDRPRVDVRLPLRPLDNRWHYVGLVYRAPELTLSDESGHSVVVANATYNTEILTTPELEVEESILQVGNMYSGCLMEGPGLVFNMSLLHPRNVVFGRCPLSTDKCVERRDVLTSPPVDNCYHEPCMRHGTCISRQDRYECRCTARYSGNNCQIDNGPPCESAPCQNGGRCEEIKTGDYKCLCAAGYYGDNCEYEVHPLCSVNPCLNNGTCRVPANTETYQCTCTPGFTGVNCELNVDDCLTAPQPPCQNGGVCQDALNNYTCICTNTGYTGARCEININECELQPGPCLNHGVCFDTYGGYVCQCQPGYAGNNCQLNQNECLSSPCLNGGTCTDLVGSYECLCPPGVAGVRCGQVQGLVRSRGARCIDFTDCPPHSQCDDGHHCVCQPPYTGVPGNCTLISGFECPTNPCKNGATCIYDKVFDIINCTCPPGYTGTYCELPFQQALANMAISNTVNSYTSQPTSSAPTAYSLSDVFMGGNAALCSRLPCKHASSCHQYPGGFYCKCEPGWTGVTCETDINECLSQPCLNGGECTQLINNFHCRCPLGYTGKLCQTIIDPCLSRPCKNNGECFARPNSTEFSCECPMGFEGHLCEINIDDCVHVTCPEFQVCYDGINSYMCRCPDGFTGENCTQPTSFCQSSPCVNGTCREGGDTSDYTCDCQRGFTGRNCDEDINECQIVGLCNQGICVNKPGGYECYCKPGYTGENCEVDFDECLSSPCKNNGTCVNKINNYECICMPGFTGKDCSYDINECESNPCAAGSTCINGLATFTCVCMEGLTGPTCEVNIDDCESSPCLNGGVCEDGLNSYTCNCTDTGHTGLRCETNIDDCASNPCMNGAQCQDGVKDYTCLCYAGYTGKNCESDILECESSPCRNRGMCLERSNISLYQNTSYDPLNPIYIDEELNMLLPLHFYQEFSYANASGFECICIPGIKGTNCEININECESSPCGPWGQCVDHVGRYECECEDGFEGDHCQRDIDECARYKPCVRGRCQDRRANYYCDCEPGWGGKNCSVPLQGCAVNQCQNGGTCKPWLQDEVIHRFNCTCSAGYHGDTCEMITTMSLGGHSYVMVNTTREEGYDIQFRFKTTLGNGLLAIGKGLTYYILELVNGRLNLHSSLLNKWEGVFIGSNLNDSHWQKVFVAINSSHLVLAANEEQTIYPINLNEGSNSSHTSFPTTYLGGVIASLSRLTHGPAAFIGCVQDVIINNEWVLPQMDDAETDNPTSTAVMPVAISSGTASWLLHGVQATCPRVAQCGPRNPCHSGGRCTDLWTSFHCTCQRPYLGHTCQYNVTAATFGYENTTDSLVTVSVNDVARRAVRSIVDISMFIRTRKPTGQIFYLGSKPRLGNTEETFVAASLVNGELIVRLKFNQTQEAYSVGGNNRLDNGFNHLIQIVRNQTLVQVKLNGSEYFRKSISATGQLDAQILYLGGVPLPLPVPSTRAVRQADVVPVPMLGATPSPTLPTDHFKGIIQDVQISNGSRTMIVEFFPLEVSELEMPPAFGEVTFVENTILEGVVSDDSCADNPCKHNGTCKVTWNDFRCECPRGYKGKSCQEMEFCQLQDCPVDSVCRNLDAGYECLANATMDGMSPPLLYALQPGDANIVADSITIMYRSKTGGTLLHIENAEGDMLSVSVYKDRVTIEWRQVPEILPRVWRFSKQIPDYQWNQIHLHLGDKYIRGGFGDWMKDDSPAFTADYNQQSWLDLLATGDILLGGVHPPPPPSTTQSNGSVTTITPGGGASSSGGRSIEDRTTYAMERRLYRTTEQMSSSNNLDASEFATESGLYEDTQTDFWNGSKGRIGENYKGCLGEVRLGNTLLAYFPLEELYPEPNLYSRQLIGLATSKPTHGCSLCFSDDCLNGGHCEDPTVSFACSCPLGYSGEMCEINVDECESAQCANNSTCLDGVGNFTCICQPGWEGWLCDIDINECYSSPCENGGTCHDKPGGFVCECPEEVTGPRCSAPRLVTCQHQPCKRGSTCLSQKDEITGNNFTCKCVPGWEGVVCDIAYCIVKPCLNGGICDSTADMVPSCKCPPGFTGSYCESNIDDCRLPSGGSPCLNGGRCVDGIASYTCDCHDTGYEGVNCQNDINECEVPVSPCGSEGKCINTVGSFICHCNPGSCGPTCLLIDPCYETHYITVVSDETTVSDGEYDGGNSIESNGSKTTSKWIRGPCQNEGVCKEMCSDVPAYECHCVNGWVGKNCTESLVATAIGDELPIGVIIGSVVGGLCALIGAGLVAACVLARTKRATRGTYSPSGQEYRNPRLEMLDNVLKPPPEERLI